MNCQQFILESVVEMAAYVAPMQPFDIGSDESWTEYEEHFDNFLIANKITELDLKRANLLATIGSSGYKLLQSLCQNNTRNKTYEELLKVMSDHLHPTPNVIAERYRFYKRDRKNGESVAMYVSELQLVLNWPVRMLRFCREVLVTVGARIQFIGLEVRNRTKRGVSAIYVVAQYI